MSTLDHSEVCARLAAMLDATEDQAAQSHTIAEHIASCPECATAARSVMQLIARYRELEQDELPPDLERRLLDQLCH